MFSKFGGKIESYGSGSSTEITKQIWRLIQLAKGA